MDRTNDEYINKKITFIEILLILGYILWFLALTTIFCFMAILMEKG